MYLYSYAEPSLPSEEDQWGFPAIERCGAVNNIVLDTYCYYPANSDAHSLLRQWYNSPMGEDTVISGLIADWLQDHRDLLLSGAVGPNPAERLEQVIEWFRQHFERGSYAHAG